METIKLDLIPSGKMPSLHASQFDDGREHGIDLFENGVAYKLDGTETLTINERKGDDCICSLDIENTFTGSNHIVFASTEQMCAVWGNNICELVIAKGEKTIGTLNFILEIEQSPTEGGIESESEIKNLERQIEAITEEVIGDNYYTAEETDEAIATATEGKADKATTYTKTQSDNRYLGKTNPTGTGYFSLNRKAGTTVGNYSVATGYRNTASGTASCAESWQTTASGDASHAEGESTVASAYAAHSEGETTTASGDDSHAEGKNSTASGNVSHAEGENNTASGYGSHAEGYGNTASGLMAHAEGVTTESSGYGSHSEGVGTIANHIGQHVFGAYNVADPSTAQPTAKGNYVEIVGNGTDDDRRRNARALDWSGNETLMGDLTYNGDKSLTSEIARLDGKIDNLPAPMIFKGTLGVGGTIQSLPDASASNEGYTYKVITDGTYAEQTAKVGDVFTSNGSAWVLIPSGDEDNDTWRNIKVNGVEKLGNGISSGAVDFVGSDNIEVEFDSNGNKVGVKTKNIYTKTEVDDIVSDAIYNVLPDDTASGSVANFNTSLELPIKSLEVDVNAVQESGTPTPQSPKAISGVSVVSVVHCHKNLYQYDESKVSQGTTTQSTVRAFYPLGFKGATSLTFSASLKSGSSTTPSDYLNIGKLRKSDGLLETLSAFIIPTGITTRTLSISSDDEVVLMSLENPTVIKSILSRYDIQIEAGSSATPYEPYNGNTKVIELGGTYYGGHFTQDKDGHRQFEVTHKAKVKLRDVGYWNYSANGNRFYVNNVSDVLQKTDWNNHIGLCDCYVEGKVGNNQGDDLAYGFYNASLYLRDSNYSDVTTWLNAVGDYYITYQLATPYVIDLPDGEPIATLAGTNNIFADTGDSEVVFKSSVNDYVSAHSGGGLLGMGGVYLGGAKSGGGEEEPDEGEDTEKTKLDEPKEEIKTIGDVKKLGGE